MNGSLPGISFGVKKSKDIMSLPPVHVPNFPADIASDKEWIKTFVQAKTADEQLTILKENLDKQKNHIDTNVVKFVVLVFFHSEAKHPIKCFLTRYVTKNNHLQETFIALLTSEITLHLENNREDVLCYKDTIPKIGMCLENFHAGTCALENAAEKIARYLIWFLGKCIHTLRSYTRPTSVTDKNTIYSLIHSALKILLHIITKIQWKVDCDSYGDPSHIKLFKEFYHWQMLKPFINDKEVPMDTKSLCGLVEIALLLEVDREYDACRYEYWKILPYLRELDDENDDVKLALYSALVTTVPIQYLQEKCIYNEAPITVIIQMFMDIVERNATEGVLVLGVARSLQHLSKGLPRLQLDFGQEVSRALLAFVWTHLDHFMDSVRHLTVQILTAVVKYYATLDADLECGALEEVLASVSRLDTTTCRGYCAGVRGCVHVLGARRVLSRLAPIPRLLAALTQPQPATAVVSTLSELLVRHSQEVEAAVIHDDWLVPILAFVKTHDLSPEVITILNNLLAQAIKLDQKLLGYILPHIKQACESPDYDLKNVLVLLSVTRGCLTKLASEPQSETQKLWGGVLPYDILNEAVVDAEEEVRLTGLALACDGPRLALAQCDLRVVLRYLTYSAGDAQPHARSTGIAILHKFIKRLFDGFRAAKRSGDEEKCQMYRDFDDQLRRQCYSMLQPGANYPRRATALQLLQVLEPRQLEHRVWKADYVEKLLLHLNDSYETNKAMALEILQHVPLELLKDENYTVRLKLDDIIRQAGSLKPIECVSAAYKLELVWRRLPDNITEGKHSSIPEAVAWHAIDRLVQAVKPCDCASYGLLHCIAHVLERVQPAGIVDTMLFKWYCWQWKLLIDRVISVCENMLEAAGRVVNSAAPEGAPLPLPFWYVDDEDESIMTPQTALLEAWRAVKEATAVLSAIGVRLERTRFKLIQLVQRLASVLAHARHRGAIELAHVALARLLHSMWRDVRPDVHSYPERMLAQLMSGLRSHDTLPADRRSAGLPFYMQALVSTQPSAGAAGSALHGVLQDLLSVAAAPDRPTLRAHACNILRALYKDASLDAAVQSYVGEGLRVALKGFEGATWEERNSSTLLLSALMTRVFGVWRTRSELSERNRMTGRVFYLRYPLLYDIMLNKLKEATESCEKLLLCPSLYPVLLILARLYPSSLEGTDSNIKLTSFVPYVVSCGRSRVLHTRRLAADACVALIAPDRYVGHIQHLLGLVSDERIERNFCHGLLLQICALLNNKPSGVDCRSLTAHIVSTQWMLRQHPPCYPLLHQYVLMLSTLLTRFGKVAQETLDTISARLSEIVFQPSAGGAGVSAGGAGISAGGAGVSAGGAGVSAGGAGVSAGGAGVSAGGAGVSAGGAGISAGGAGVSAGGAGVSAGGAGVSAGGAGVSAGRELCLSDCLRLMLTLATGANQIADIIVRAVQHDVHEVSGLALDRLLAMYGRRAEAGAEAEAVLSVLRGRADYLRCMVDALKSETLWRCDPQRAANYLEVLVAEGDTQQLVLSVPSPTAAAAILRHSHRYHDVIRPLVQQIDYGLQATAHLYLESLINYAVGRVKSLHTLDWNLLVYVMCGNVGASTPRARRVAAAALHEHAARMLHDTSTPPHEGADSWSITTAAHNAAKAESCVFVSVARLLRAPDCATRALAAGAACRLARNSCDRAVVPERAGALLLAECAGRPRALELLTELALADGSGISHQDSSRLITPQDECRIFDKESESVDDEEVLWTAACAAEVVDLCRREGVDPVAHIIDRIKKMNFQVYFDTNSLWMAMDGKDVSNPLFKVFVRKLKGEI